MIALHAYIFFPKTIYIPSPIRTLMGTLHHKLKVLLSAKIRLEALSMF